MSDVKSDRKGDASCPEPACKSKKNLFASMKIGSKAKAGKVDSMPCPCDREELGRSSWSLLHTIAAYYPVQPSEQQQQHARNLVESMAILYPCEHCAEDFAKTIKQHPPRVESQEKFSVWMCEQHNMVNEKLGKPSLKCQLPLLLKRWRTGHKDCWEDTESASSSLGH
ncbi:hypothetical protein CYMTET_31996 [Cymbomonas tetramitiformis]|uniref:Sulfhydryl oxidase n=1 Tax=Cymbomonas tetramitiformis TaxID=36881 RepID=A0AAE0FFW7_9CHLO|nr:hypothetical protein CYMTET_31996 [Cymbomonas tetramitiformis]